MTYGNWSVSRWRRTVQNLSCFAGVDLRVMKLTRLLENGALFDAIEWRVLD